MAANFLFELMPKEIFLEWWDPWYGYHTVAEPSHEYEIGEKMFVSSTNQISTEQKKEKSFGMT